MKLVYEILFFLGLIAFLVFAYLHWNYYPDKELAKSHRYTIGVVTSIESQSNGARNVNFSFTVNDHKYYGSLLETEEYEDKIAVGMKIFIKFNPKDPDNARTPSCFIPVSDTLKASGNGWKTLPKMKQRLRQCW